MTTISYRWSRLLARTVLKSCLNVRSIRCIRVLLLGAALVPAGLSAAPVVMNNGDPGTSAVGAWTLSTVASDSPYGGSALYLREVGSYTFTPTLAPGTYRVSLWWTTRGDYLTRVAQLSVMTRSGAVTVKLNQSINGGRWNLMGTYNLDSTASVKIITSGTRRTCADAVQFELVEAEVVDPRLPAPTGLTATAGSAAINLNWNDVTDTEFATYAVYRSTTSGSGFALLAHGVGQSAYSDGTATAGTAYYYCVAAVDTAGNVSPLSAQAWATIPLAGDSAPAVPSGLTASAGSSSISLNWNDNQETDLAGYSVFRSTTSGTGFVLLAQNVPQSAYNDSTALVGTTYYYIVFASDTAGNTSAASAQVSAKIATPTGFLCTIAWNSPTTNSNGSSLTDLAGFKVYMGTSSRRYTSVFPLGKVNQYTTGSLPAGTYYFTVTSVDTSGNESVYASELICNLP